MRAFLGGNRTPTAWDHLFEGREAGFVRCAGAVRREPARRAQSG